MEKTTLDNVGERSLILASYREVVDLIKDLVLERGSLSDAVVIISEPEPEREEATEYQIMANWFAKLRVEHYRIRASGHYYPYELKGILAEIRPRKVLPIHTQNPWMLKIEKQS